MGFGKRLYRIFEIALVLFIVGEVGVRVVEAFFMDGEVASLANHLVFEDGYFTLPPNTTIVQPERQGDRYYTTNRLGYRDQDRGPKGDKKRVLFLGDSITFGLGVQDDETIPRRVEALLNEGAQGDGRYETINLGLFSYSPAHQVPVLRDIGLPLEPDLIVVQIYMNDFYLGQEGSKTKEGPEPLSRRLRAAYRVLLDRSALYRRLRQARDGAIYALVHDLRREYFLDTINAAEAQNKLALLESHPDEDFEAFAGLIGVRDMAAEAGIPLFVVLTPQEAQLYRDDFDGINQRLRAFHERNGIDFYDALETLRASDERTKVIQDGSHFGPLGTRVMAEFLLPKISERLEATPPR